MTPATRTELPQRRSLETFTLRHWNANFSVGIGRYPDGTIGEIFINGEKCGTQLDVVARDCAVILSLAFQHGLTIANLRHAVTRDGNGEASGPIGALLDLLHDEEEAAVSRAVGALG
jgi:hypothetical protein